MFLTFEVILVGILAIIGSLTCSTNPLKLCTRSSCGCGILIGKDFFCEDFGGKRWECCNSTFEVIPTVRED